MANAFSFLADYDEPLYQPDIALIAQVGGMKQNKYDYNKIKTQSALDSKVNIDLEKEVDQQHLRNNIEKSVEKMNSLQNSDLSQASNVTELLKVVDEIVDKDVRTAVSSTALYRNDVKKWQDFQDKHPKDFNIKNKAYAFEMSGANEWRSNNEKQGQVYRGGASVIPYTDVNTKANKNLQKVLKDFGVETNIEYRDLEGMDFIRDKVTKKVIPKDKVISALNSTLSEQDRLQLQIDGWAHYSTKSDEEVDLEYKSFVNGRAEDIGSKIEKIDTYTSTHNLSPIERQQYIDLRKSLVGRKSEYENMDLGDKSRMEKTNTMYFDSFQNSMVNTYSMDVVEDVEIDKSRLEEAQFLLDVKKEKRKQEGASKKSEVKFNIINATTDKTGNKEEGIDLSESNVLLSNTVSSYIEEAEKILATSNLPKKDISKMSNEEYSKAVAYMDAHPTYEYHQAKGSYEKAKGILEDSYGVIQREFEEAFVQAEEIDFEGLGVPEFKVIQKTVQDGGGKTHVKYVIAKNNTTQEESQNEFKRLINKKKKNQKLDGAEEKSLEIYMMHYIEGLNESIVGGSAKEYIRDRYLSTLRDVEGGESVINGSLYIDEGVKILKEKFAGDSEKLQFLSNFELEYLTSEDRNKTLNINAVESLINKAVENGDTSMHLAVGRVNTGGFLRNTQSVDIRPTDYSRTLTELSSIKLEDAGGENINPVDKNLIPNAKETAELINRTLESNVKANLDLKAVTPYSSLSESKQTQILAAIKETSEKGEYNSLTIQDLKGTSVNVQRGSDGTFNTISIPFKKGSLDISNVDISNTQGSTQIFDYNFIEGSTTVFNTKNKNAPNIDLEIVKPGVEVQPATLESPWGTEDRLKIIGTRQGVLFNDNYYKEYLKEQNLDIGNTSIPQEELSLINEKREILDSYRRGTIKVSYKSIPNGLYTPFIEGVIPTGEVEDGKSVYKTISRYIPHDDINFQQITKQEYEVLQETALENADAAIKHYIENL